ncbi:MAG: hypothetical protein AAF219_10305 [Myxococcota bacterium]
MSSSISRLQLTALFSVAMPVWGVLLILDGVGVSASWAKHLSTVVGVTLVLLTVFDRWLWRWSWLQGWFVKKPYIGGTWRVSLKSDWRDPKTGLAIPPIDGFLSVRQTYSGLSLRLMTKESASESLAADLVGAPDATYRAASVYRNDPGVGVRDRSPIHYGALLLDVQADDPVTLAGQYWTDRSTRGELRSAERTTRVVGSYQAGLQELGNELDEKMDQLTALDTTSV